MGADRINFSLASEAKPSTRSEIERRPGVQRRRGWFRRFAQRKARAFARPRNDQTAADPAKSSRLRAKAKFSGPGALTLSADVD